MTALYGQVEGSLLVRMPGSEQRSQQVLEGCALLLSAANDRLSHRIGATWRRLLRGGILISRQLLMRRAPVISLAMRSAETRFAFGPRSALACCFSVRAIVHSGDSGSTSTPTHALRQARS